MAKILSLILIQPETNLKVEQLEHYSVIDLDANLLEHEASLIEAGTPLNVKIQIRDPNYGLFETEKNMYGVPFFYVEPRQIAELLDKIIPPTEWDDSIMKFLNSIDSKVKVVPWWR